MFRSEIGVQSVLRVEDEVLRTGRVVVNKTADTLPKFQTDYMFIRTVAESKTQPCITFVGTRSGAVISFMCARKGGYEDLTKEILRHFEAYGFLNPVIIQCDKEMSIIDVCRKVARVLRFAPETSHQSNGFVEAVHGHIQGLARCYQRQIETDTGIQLHLPFHLQSGALDLCSQDSQCDPTAELHSNICLELHMYHLCACLVNRYSL